MKKENCTKGPVIMTDRDADHGEGSHIVGANERIIANVIVTFGEGDEDDANAELIAQAFNVLHETGCTPRELADMLHEYRELLAEARITLYVDLYGCSGNVQHFYTNKLKHREDLERDPETGKFFPISKHQPKSPA